MAPSSSSLAACAGQVVRVFDGSESSAPVSIIADEQVHCVRWNHTGKVLAVGGTRGRIRLFHASGAEIPGKSGAACAAIPSTLPPISHLPSPSPNAGGDLPADPHDALMDRIEALRFTRGSRFVLLSGSGPCVLM